MRSSSLLKIAAVAFAVAFVATCVFAWAFSLTNLSTSLLGRFALSLFGFLAAIGATYYIVRRVERSRRDFERFVDSLSRLNPAHDYLDDLPSLGSNHPWRSTSEKIRRSMQGFFAKIQELEHLKTSQDIRSRRASAKAEQIKNVLAGMSDPMLAVNECDDVILANPGAKQLFGFEDDAERIVLSQVIECREIIDLVTSVRQRKNVTNRSEEIELLGSDGAKHWYRATASKLAGEQDEGESSSVAPGAVLALREIDDQKALQRRNAEFVSSVSHEMKTPLAGIKAYVELLADGDAEDEATREEFLGIIQSQADRLQRLVENLLDLARIEAGVVEVHKRVMPLNEILEEALRVVQHSAEKKNITITSELSALHISVLADRDMLLQSAINLLSNAVKYTPDGGHVVLRSRLQDDQARFEVQDDGVGLSPEDCEKVFEKFYRVKKDKDMAQGTGLGLPLAKHIAEDVHGGRLTLESQLGQGSTFAITIPCASKLRNETTA